MKLLVTGGAGFIGSNFIKVALEAKKKIKITNIDKITYAGNLKNLSGINIDKRYKFIKADICNRKIVKNLIRQHDYVVNFAAESHVDRSIKDSSDFIKTNIDGVKTLLDACKKYGIKRFVQISTDEVYGSKKRGLFKESDNLLPNSPYSASKASADLLVRAYFETFSIPVIIVRSCNNFGPNQFPEKIIPLFITNLLEGKKVPVYKTGQNVREWIYVKDNCLAILKILQKGKVGEIYNIGSGFRLKNIDLTRKILKALNKDENFIKFVKDRLGHDFRYALNSSKLRKLGWKPNFSFDKALNDTICWYSENIRWWRPLKRKS